MTDRPSMLAGTTLRGATLVPAALCLAGLLLASPALAQDPAPAGEGEAAAERPAWVYPFAVRVGGQDLEVHEPSVRTHDRLTGAVELRFPVALVDGLGQKTYGAMDATATARVDVRSRLIRLDDVKPTNVVCHGVAAGDMPFDAAAVAEKVTGPLMLRLESLTARPGAAGKAGADPKLNSQPPEIHVRRTPSVLVQIDGELQMLDIKNFPFQYVGNSASVILHKPADGSWFLLLDGRWAQGESLEGPWKPLEGKLPIELTQIPLDSPRGFIRLFIPGTREFKERARRAEKDGAAAPESEAPLPDVIVTKNPAELVLLNGDPLFTLVSPTVKLMTVANTESDLLFHPKTALYYLLLSGRWFKAEQVDGPWKPAFTLLPEEFKDIPRDHRMAHVLAAVPGTPECDEAIARAGLVEVTVLKKNIQYEVKHVDGKVFSAPLADSQAKHCPSTEDDVFEADGGFYVCAGGAWLTLGKGEGHFRAAESVPNALDTFTAATPYLHVSFVDALGPVEDGLAYAVSGHYLGGFRHKERLVYGTGWPLKGLLRNDNWYPSPRTYGEGRWYDSRTGTFQPRSVSYDESGSPVAAAWSPYTASYGRVRLYGDRYGQGGRRMFPFNKSKLAFDTDAGLPDYARNWSGYVVSRNGVPEKELPLGDRSAPDPAVEGDVIVADGEGKVYRLGGEDVETWDGTKWAAATKPDPAVRDALRRKHWVNSVDANHAAWAAKRRSPLPVNPEVSGK